jgi:single-strand DNA-binding protein
LAAARRSGANYKKKGDPILMEGRLQYRSWQAQDGARRSAVDVVADRVQFLSRSTSPQAQAKLLAPAKDAAGTTLEGGWGLAKQLQEGEDDDTKSKGENFEEIPA